jgi:uncharacterized protein (UPF0332 family)
MADFSGLLRDGDIRPMRRDDRQINATLEGADDSVAAARSLLAGGHFGAARDNGYEAMLKAGLALMLHHGFRPQAAGHHVTVVRFTKEALGGRGEGLVANFDRLRRQRNDRLYEAKGFASQAEAEAAVKSAKRLIEIVRKETGTPL